MREQSIVQQSRERGEEREVENKEQRCEQECRGKQKERVES